MLVPHLEDLVLISTSVFFGEYSGRRERSSNVSLSAAPRPIHLYAVVGDTPYRRHNSRTFAPGPLARLTNSRRSDTVDTSLHPSQASPSEDCSGAVNVSTIVSGTYTGRQGRRPLLPQAERARIATKAAHANAKAAGPAGPPEALPAYQLASSARQSDCVSDFVSFVT
jgi:hypothetical protein